MRALDQYKREADEAGKTQDSDSDNNEDLPIEV
jgi:hypothetical protein